MQAPIVVVNPAERGNHQERRWFDTKPRFVLWFGACAPTYLMVWGDLEDALEECADWLAEHAPGHIMLTGHGNDKRDPELDTLLEEACQEHDLEWPIPDDCWGDSDAMQPYWDAEQEAYADLTSTERGYIPSDEWGIVLNEHATRADVLAFIAEVGARHYGDGPVCDITRPQARPIPSGRYVNVSAHHSEPGKGLSYGNMRVRLVDPCDTEGWDVIDVIMPDGSEGSVYSFSVTR